MTFFTLNINKEHFFTVGVLCTFNITAVNDKLDSVLIRVSSEAC